MKKLLSVFLTLCLVFTILPMGMFTITASAATDGDYTYWIYNEETTISGYNGSGGNITIPSTLGGYPVTKIFDSAFENCRITSVTIPDSITTIGDSAFYSCRSLTSITIPDSVTTIGDSAFWGCTSLNKLNIT